MSSTSRLPLDSVVTLGGNRYHTSWFGDSSTKPGGFDPDYRYGLIGPLWRTGDPDAGYYSQPPGSVSITTLASALQSGGWKFYSAVGADYGHALTITRSEFESTIVDWSPYQPYWQHAALCDMTDTRRSGGDLALYSVTDYSTLAADVAAGVGGTSQDVVLLVVDGTGSFGSGAVADPWVSGLISAFESAKPGNDTRLVVVKYSDYDPEGPIPAYRAGAWDGINSGITADVLSALNFDTGNGGDVNESQFEAIWAGMQGDGLGIGPGGTAEGRTGDKAVIVYTDAASTVGWAATAAFPLRRWPPNGNGGSGPTRHYPRSPGRRGAY